MAGTATDKARELILGGTLNLKTADIYIMLLDASGDASVATEYVGDIAAHEVTGTGYTGGYGGSGRKSIGATGDRTVSSADGVASLDVANLTWTGANFGTIGQVVTFVKGTSDSDSLVVSFEDISHITTNGGDWTYAIATAGLWTLE